MLLVHGQSVVFWNPQKSLRPIAYSFHCIWHL